MPGRAGGVAPGGRTAIHTERGLYLSRADVAALISHLKFVRNHQAKIEKVAAVSDSGFLSVIPSVARHFVKAEVKSNISIIVIRQGRRMASRRQLIDATNRPAGCIWHQVYRGSENSKAADSNRVVVAIAAPSRPIATPAATAPALQ
jgi:hypothetical protein